MTTQNKLHTICLSDTNKIGTYANLNYNFIYIHICTPTFIYIHIYVHHICTHI